MFRYRRRTSCGISIAFRKSCSKASRQTGGAVRIRSRRFFLHCLVVSVAIGGLGSSMLQAAPPPPLAPPPRLQAVLLNGGGQPSINYYSHLLHVKQFLQLLQHTGMAPPDITIFNADGAAPQADFAVRDVQPEADFWLLHGTRLERPLRPPLRYENSVIDGFTLHPATRVALESWFTDAAQRLQPGDTLLFYVTDHGTKNAADLNNNRITLWGEHETISVTELRAFLSRLHPRVRVVTLMSQCYSGAFAQLMYADPNALPTGNVCGFFSAPADRLAYGCYPENRDKDHVGHSFAFLQALAAGDTFPQAHRRVLVTDQTPDVPLTTTDIYLQKLLQEAAQQRGQAVEALIDTLLKQAWQEPLSWEPEVRLLDSIGQAFGYFSPRSLGELQEHTKALQEISEQFTTYSKAWTAAFHALTETNLQRFVSRKSDWQERLDDKAVSLLKTDERQLLVRLLLPELWRFVQEDSPTQQRLLLLQDKSRSATRAYYRMQVRLAVALRMRTLLSSIAGRVYLAQEGTTAQRQAYENVRTCEAFTLAEKPVVMSTPTPPAPFPAYQEEIALAKAVLPGWMGIRFKQVEAPERQRLELPPGASLVQTVYPDSPAQQAGMEPGDVILGPPNAPFTEQKQIREWIMTAPIGTPTPLQVRRGDHLLSLTLTPQPYPLQWPALPGIPQAGSEAPALPDITPYRGTLPATVHSGGPHLLFFWATWCVPCKASVPELLAFERDRGIPVIAITDESAHKLDGFFQKHDAAFPAIVVTDELRKAFLAYGVSGTPTFVLTDTAGKVQNVSVGYRPQEGLALPGWSWTK